jgi:hypothetical protein
VPLELKLYLQSGRKTSKVLVSGRLSNAVSQRWSDTLCSAVLSGSLSLAYLLNRPFCVQWDIPDNRKSCHAAVRLAVVAEMVSMVSGAIHYV